MNVKAKEIEGKTDQQNVNWHILEIDEVIKETGTKPEGLTKDEASSRLEKYGPNELTEKKKKPAWIIFLKQFKDFMILVLIAAAVISGLVGDVVDTIIILVIVFLNAIIGFIQEYRAEEAMLALRKLAEPHSTVLREGKSTDIPSSELVPGDIVLLEAGMVIPADARLSETHSLNVDEASLTGESVAVNKTSTILKDQEISLGDRINMGYKGTLIKGGRGKGIVIATGMQTEIGRIAQLLQQKETITPLQKRMADFGKKLSYLIILICIILFVVGLLRGEDKIQMLLVAISLAVAAIPEALPALITIALARGAKRLVKKNVLIRKLPAV
ncbi:MAG TPA: HAD-IC family P-type ATPase, partial [Chitinophagaceae bacterium]|nr:HAD-IC family P-type ATPase [Chitinophagaceae bacterium]